MRISLRRVTFIICLSICSYCWLAATWHRTVVYGQLASTTVAMTTEDARTSSHMSMASHDSLRQCNLPARFSVAEGQPIEGFELRNVILFFRHGIRTPLADTHLHVRPANCKMTSSSDQSDVIADFVRVFTNASQSANGTWKYLIGRYGSYPNSDRCSKSQLTSSGANQMLELGRSLRKAYNKNEAFRAKFNDLHLVSNELWLKVTTYARTVHSAIAFLYGFLQPQFSIAELNTLSVHTTSNIYLCDQAFSAVPCHCPALYSLAVGGAGGVAYSEEEALLKDAVYVNLTRHLHEHNIKRVPHVREVVDAVMPTLCQDRGQGQAGDECTFDEAGGAGQGHLCFPLSWLDNMWRVLNNEKRRELSSDGQRHKLRLLAFPILNEISLRMRQVRQGRHVPSFTLYQAHDHTITSLLVALDLGHEQWPPFASCLTLELYKRRASRLDNGYFLRFLYNGKDVTAGLGWCRRVRDAEKRVVLCSLESFLNYLSNPKSTYFTTGSYASDCSLAGN